MKKFWSLFFASFFIVSFLYSQQSDSARIILTNGKVIDVKFISHIEEGIVVLEKGRLTKLNPEEVFSYSLDKTEIVVYTPKDSTEYSVDEMRNYVNGRRLARAHHKSPGSTALGFVVGASGGYFLVFWSLLSTAVVTAADASINPYLFNKETKKLKPEFEKNEPLKQGFNYQAKRKKAKNQLSGGGIGIGIGFGLYQYLKTRD
jgi:hypothetical protein